MHIPQSETFCVTQPSRVRWDGLEEEAKEYLILGEMMGSLKILDSEVPGIDSFGDDSLDSCAE